ncbi:unnamed protein product [Linum tenue]|uniref:Cytochrome P450 n=1 Tax=Linum tenue TaxID=586396 RepID=A0AAV0KUA9_9ROSI|nr:unnamed protein product [Linum tenue]
MEGSMAALNFLPTSMAGATLMIISILFLLISRQSKRRRPNLPPSPPSLPFIGHLHLLKLALHRTLQTLSTKYGPIFSLTLGARNVVVVSSPSLAEECLQQNDVVFANRPHSILGWKILAYNYTSIGAAPYGPHWRNLRRLSAVELLSAPRLNSFLHVRTDEVTRLVNGLVADVSAGSGFGKVEMKLRLVGLSMNMVMRMVAGKRYFGTSEEKEGRDEEEEGEEFKELIREAFELSGTSNHVDFLPVLKWVDFSGLEQRMWRAHRKMDAFFQGLIDEHRSSRLQKEEEEQEDGVGRLSRKTMIDTMLTLQESEPENYSDDIIKEILDKARAEIDNAVGNNRLVQESDCIDLPYLQCIISETFRLYPVGPLLIPHQSSEDCTVGGYFVSKETMLFVNTWAIHRDPTVWKDPTRFWPERHSEGEANAYQLLPFGAGRRSCPGIALANRTVSVALGTLIQCFEWKRVGEELLDMTEGPGLTMPKLEPLEALCKPRKFMEDVLITVQGDK